ncbi:hypothetical protein LCGC14_2344950, partial [marine sediment metagenome]
RRAIEMAVGVRADFAGLLIDPRPPAPWDRYRLVKNFRGCKIHADLHRGDSLSVKLDGQEVDPLIPAERLAEMDECKLEITYV